MRHAIRMLGAAAFVVVAVQLFAQASSGADSISAASVSVSPPPHEVPLMQPTPTSRPALPTTSPATLPMAASNPTISPATSGPTELEHVVITSNLERDREKIAPELGAVSYTIGPNQIAAIPGGDNASFQQVLLRAPGVVEDSYGQEHVRGEHANITYRINGVLLPQPLNGFGQEIDSHLIDSVTLIDGSLPAQFGFHTAGIVDITTKNGAALQQSEVSTYGGSYGTLQSSVETGGSVGKWDYFISGTYLQDQDGIENPINSLRPIHDETDQTRAFTYLGYNIDDTSRVTLLINGYNGSFQIPNTPGLPPQYNLAGVTSPDSASLTETQKEQEYYSVVSYQKTCDRFSMQLSAFVRYADIHFTPDPTGDLVFQGLAGEVDDPSITSGLQFDSSYVLDKQHTLRGGLIADYTQARSDTNASVFPTDPMTGLQSSDTPIFISDNTTNTATESGIYLQDEWKLNSIFTLNYGARYDRFDSSFDNEDQVSPRANLVWKMDKDTNAHAGYARYFVTPPVQDVTTATLTKFNNTTNAAAVFQADPPKAERSNYYDVGISHNFSKAWAVNLDGYYKQARNLIDLGQFGDAVILAPYNYAKGCVEGGELSSTYHDGPWSLFGNFAVEDTYATQITSQQFEFSPAELAYIDSHNVHLDHQSTYTASGGISYAIGKNDLVYLDMLYGSGLRAGFADTLAEEPYYPLNIGYQHKFHIAGNRKDVITARIDITNVTDERYQLRDGNGIGTSAAQWGQRRGIFAGLSYSF